MDASNHWYVFPVQRYVSTSEQGRWSRSGAERFLGYCPGQESAPHSPHSRLRTMDDNLEALGRNIVRSHREPHQSSLRIGGDLEVSFSFNAPFDGFVTYYDVTSGLFVPLQRPITSEERMDFYQSVWGEMDVIHQESQK